MNINDFCKRLNSLLNKDGDSMYDIRCYEDEKGSHIYDANCYLDVTNDTWSTDVFLDVLDEFGCTFDFTDKDCDYLIERY